MARSQPAVTVVLPVYNALPYLDLAIESIARQTVADFQLKIFDDHSSDGSYERAVEWARRDPRITVTRSTSRLGPSGSSEAAARLAQSEFVARMDADDIAMPDRLQVQLAVLQDNPRAVLVGSVFDMIDGAGTVIRPARPGMGSRSAPPIAHASILFRREAFERAGGYRPDTDYFEDQDLYRRMAALGDVMVIDRPLIQLRFAGQHARLRDDRLAVLKRINRLYSGEVETGETGRRHIAPLAFYSVGVLAALGLERPRLLGLMIERMRFDLPLQALAIMAFIGLAELSPRLARGINRLFTGLRALVLMRPGRRGSVWVWQAERT